MSLLKYFSWKKTISTTKEILHEQPHLIAKEILQSKITAANEITAALQTACKKEERKNKLTDGCPEITNMEEGQDSCML